MKKQISLFLSLLVSANASFAEPTIQPLRADSRFIKVTYHDNQVVPIYGTTFISTQLVFGVNERIIDVEGGDRDGWMVTYQKNLPNILFIKPTTLGSSSNMTVVTNHHTYYFQVKSNRQLKTNLKQTYAIKFEYPEDKKQQRKPSLASHKSSTKIAQPVKQNKTYNRYYTFNGSPILKPVRVFDDGKFTFFELGDNQPVPAVFVVNNQKGEEIVVNSRRQGSYLVVHRTAPQFTLRLGKDKVASIFNHAQIAQLKSRRMP